MITIILKKRFYKSKFVKCHRNHFFMIKDSKPNTPGSQFPIPGYRIVRKDRNKNRGVILFYINEDIPFKIIKSKQLPGNLEILTLQIILDKMKILLMGIIQASIP